VPLFVVAGADERGELDVHGVSQILAPLKRPGPYCNPALAKQMKTMLEAQSRRGS
jgi:hypothetical protein